MRTRKVVAAALALGLGLGASLIGALPATAEPIIGLDDPGQILTTATALHFEGTTETSISHIAISLPGGEEGDCTPATADPWRWACDYTVDDVMAEGEGTLHFTFDDPSSAAEDMTFTVEAPEPTDEAPEPVVTLDAPEGTILTTDTDVNLSGTSTAPLSAIGITFPGGAHADCAFPEVESESDPDDWSCSYAADPDLPLTAGDATLDVTFADSAEHQATELAFTLESPTAALDPGLTIKTTDHTVDFSGTTNALIDQVSISFSVGDPEACTPDPAGPETWTCEYTSDSDLPAGDGHVDVTFDSGAMSGPLPFTVDDHAAAPLADAPTFGPGSATFSAALTGGADNGVIRLYNWNGYYGPYPAGPPCDFTASPCTTGLWPGAWELRATQDWGDADSTRTSYNFRVPYAPDVDWHLNGDGSLRFSGRGTPSDLITVTAAGYDDPLCTATVYRSGFSGGAWSCTTSSLDPGSYDVSVTAQDDGAGFWNGYNYAHRFGLHSTYVSGGISSATHRSIEISPLPSVDHLFVPGGVVVTADPAGDATYVGIQLLGGYGPVDGCPSPYSWYAAHWPFRGVAPGENTCSFLSLRPGLWGVRVHQDNGDRHTADERWVTLHFVVPYAPVIGTVIDNGDLTATVSGSHAPALDIVHVVNEGDAEVCLTPALVDGSGNWSCRTAGLPAGPHTLRAYVEDTEDATHWWLPPTYIAGGLSAASSSVPVTLLVPPPAAPGTTAPGTTPPGPPAPPADLPASPIWSFDLAGLNLGNVHPGDKFTLHGTGLPVGSTVTFELHSTPVALGSATVGPDGAFTLSGTIPASTEPGEHHIVATLTGPGLAPSTVDKALTVTGDTATGSLPTESPGGSAAHGEADAHDADAAHLPATAPNILTDSLNPIAEVFTDPGRVPAAFAAGLVLLLFAIMPAHLLNATIGEQYERLARRVPRLRTQPKWYLAAKTAFVRAPVLGGVVLTAVTAFLFAFADSSFGFNLHSLRLVIALAAALFVVTYLANAITGAILRRAWDVDVAVSVRPLGLILTVVGVILSRILDFSPGFLIGLAIGLTIATKAAAAQAWKAVLIRTSVIVVFGVAAWITYSSLAPGVHHDPTFWNELVLEFFVAVATEGVVMLLIELLPFHLLEGERLYRRSRLLWAAAYGALLVVFILAVVPWEGNWRELGESFWPWFTVVAIFGVVCVAIYLYFRFLAPEHEEEGGEPDTADEHDRIAVGDD